jgi:hypothetical protein
MTKQSQVNLRGRLANALALLALSGISWVNAGFLLRDDVFLFGDHPGHYWITWYTLSVAAPLHHRLIDWIPYWYAGYPELQFTPPGYVLLAWLLNAVTFAKLSTPLVYEIVVFIGYALPGFTFYYAISHMGFERRAALLGGVFALIFLMFFDGATSLFVGMIGSRLAFALIALVFVWTIDWFENRGARYGAYAALTLAAAILAHPYHAIGIVLALGLYILARRLPVILFGSRLLIVIVAALALDAFWVAPLFARSSTAMIPVIRGTLDQTWRLMTDASLFSYVLLALPVFWRAWRERVSTRRAVLIVLLTLPWLLGIAMISTHAVLIDQAHIYSIDPVRMIGEYFFSLIWLAALGASEISRWIAVLFQRRIPAALSGWAITLAIGALVAIPFEQSALYYQPRQGDEPRFLSEAITDYRLDELWRVLGETPGRVLFVSYSTNLNAFKTAPFPTTLTSLTPLFSKRPIIGGTYTAWSPIAAQLWVGKTHPPVLRGLSQDEDDQTLFGVPLVELSDAQLAQYCQRLNITAIVASINDYQTRILLDESPLFHSYYNNGFFFVYKPRDIQASWVQAEGADVEPVSLTDDQIEMHVRSAQDNAQVILKEYAYPLWRAYDSTGKELPITEDSLALMRIALPVGQDYSVALQYKDDTPEHLGNSISFASALFFMVIGAFAFRKRQGRKT